MDSQTQSQGCEVNINPMSKADFADFAYCYYLFTLHRAYGSLTGREATERLFKESTGITCEAKNRLEICGVFSETNSNSLPSPPNIQETIMERITRLHFPNVSNVTIKQALCVRDDSHMVGMTLISQVRNLIMRANPSRVITSLVTFSMTNNGGLLITLHISERKRVWLIRIFRTALLSIVMSRGNLQSSYVLFGLFSFAWTLQRVARYASKLWHLSASRPDPESSIISEFHEVISQERLENEILRDSLWQMFRNRLFHSLRLGVFVIAAFCMSLNPNYHPH